MVVEALYTVEMRLNAPEKVFTFSFASGGGWKGGRPPLFSSAPGFYRSTVEVLCKVYARTLQLYSCARWPILFLIDSRFYHTAVLPESFGTVYSVGAADEPLSGLGRR